MMIAFQVVNLLLVFFFYHPPTFAAKRAKHGKSKRQLLAEFDWIGLFLFVAGCTLFIVGLSWGGSLYPWTSGTTLAPIIIGFLTLVGLGFYERYGTMKEALFPPRLFKAMRQWVLSRILPLPYSDKSSFTVPMLVMAIGGMQYYSNATLWTRLAQLLYASDEISKGLYAEVLPLGSVGMSEFSVYG